MFLIEKLYKKMKVKSVFKKSSLIQINSVLSYRQIHVLWNGKTPHGIG